MDTKTLSLDFGQEDSERLKEILRRMGEFIAYFEVIEGKMMEWRKEIDTAFSEQQQGVLLQLSEIRETTNELREVMTEAGAARWRVSAEHALSQGREHVHQLERVGKEQLRMQEERNEQFYRIAKKSFERLDRASNHTIKHINEAIHSVNLPEFRQLADHSRQVVEEASSNAIATMKIMCSWFHWKNLSLAAVITLIVSLTMGLYLNDEFPWEIHRQVVLQRSAGKALIDAWPSLSESEKERILKHGTVVFT